MSGCEELNINPPDFEGLDHFVAVSPSQVSLHWEAAQDDLTDTDEIVYAIWVAEDGETLDEDGEPQFVTGEGANAFNLIGLTADTTYQVLVRAEDRGGNRSENSVIDSVQTTTEGAGLFRPEQIVAFDRNVSSLVVGTLETDRPRAIGAVSGDRITWWERNDSGSWVESDAPDVDAPTEILQAVLIRLRDEAYDDLFLVTATGLIQRNNNGSGRFSSGSGTFFPEIAQPETLDFQDLNDDEDLDLVYANPLGRILFYAGDGDGGFEFQDFTDTSVVPDSLQVADLDGREGLDLVLLCGLGPAVILAEDDNFSFGSLTWLDLPSSFSGPFDRLLVADDDGDGDADLHLYRRDASNHVTRMYRYHNDGDGDFDGPDEWDLDGAAYGSWPVTTDLDADGFDDVLFPQGESNNAVLYRGNNLGWSDIAYALGGDDAPDRVWVGWLDSDTQNDVILLSDDSQSMTVLLTQQE